MTGRLLAGLALAASCAVPARAAGSGGLVWPPLMVSASPYGSPFAMAPAASPAAPPIRGEAWLPKVEAEVSPVPAPVIDGRLPARVPAPSAGFASGSPDELRAAPGSFARTPTVIPTFPDPTVPDRKRIVAPHLANPDLEVALDKRTKLGVFGEVGRVELDTRAGAVPTVRAHGLGAGLSLQYRFGQ